MQMDTSKPTNTEANTNSDECEELKVAWVALREINDGNASGCKPCLLGRAVVEGFFYQFGRFFILKPPLVSVVIFVCTLVILGVLSVGFYNARLETNEEELWIEKDGRLKVEIEYTERYLPSEDTASNELLIQVVRNGDFRSSLGDHLDLLRKIRAISVHRNYESYKLDDLCVKNAFPSTLIPALDALLTGLNPCTVLTPLDCFWEGSFIHEPANTLTFQKKECNLDWSHNVSWSNVNISEVMNCLEKDSSNSGIIDVVKKGLDQAGVEGYNERSCFQESTFGSDCPSQVAADVSETLRGGCTGFATKAMNWPEQILVAGNPWRDAIPGAKPEALQTIIQLMGANVLRQKYNQTHKDVHFWEEVLVEWEREFTRVIASFHGKSGDQFHGWSSHSATDVVEQFSETGPELIIIGYLLMLLYCAFAFSRFDLVRSRAGAGSVGLILVVCSCAGALGLCSFVGIPFNATSLHVLPFLVLGLGVDDMFVIGDSFFENDDLLKSRPDDISLKKRITETLRNVGPNITLTSITNSCGFFLATLIPIPAMSTFSLQVGIAVVFNYFVILFGFTSYVVIDTFRIKYNLMDILCFIPIRRKSKKQDTTAEGAREISTVPGRDTPEENDTKEDGNPPADMADIQPADPTEEIRTPHNEPKLSKESIRNKLSRAFHFFSGHSIITKLVVNYYSPLLQNFFAKLVILAIFCCVLVPLSITGCLQVKDGLNLLEIVPQNTKEYGFVEASLNYFTFFDIYVVTKKIDYPNKQFELLQMQEELENLRHVVKHSEVTGSPFWLKDMISYYETFEHRICVLKEATLDSQLYSTLEGLIGIKDHCSESILLKEAKVMNNEEKVISIIPPKAFYHFLTVWLAVDPVHAGVALPEFRPVPPKWEADTISVLKVSLDNSSLPTSPDHFEYAQMPFYVDGLQDTADYVELITKSREIIGKYSKDGISAYPRGIPYVYWEQYFGLRDNVLKAIGLILLVSFITASFFLMDPWTGFILVLMLILTTVQVFGFMGWIDIRFSAIPAVTVIVTVGVAVESTAPLAFYFVQACGTLNQRMHQALQHRFTPILNGGISTFLGIIMLAFSPFPFITKYFFVLLLSCIIFSHINGMILLPVMLSLIGSPSQARPKGQPLCQ